MVTNNDINERVAVLEVKVDSALATQSQIMSKLDSISLSLTKHKGFIGGVTFLFSSLWAFLLFSKDWLVTHIK